METKNLTFGTFFWRISASHMVTYFIAGILAGYLLNYEELFETGTLSCFMRPVDSPWVAVGPALQIIRGLIFSLALWPFRSIFLTDKKGWLKLWILIIGLSILSTTGPSPGSIEGMIYTVIPVKNQILGYLEVVPQTCLFSLLVVFWYHYPKKIWNILSIIFVALIILMCTMGFFASNINQGL
jgi:hypothetical protein